MTKIMISPREVWLQDEELKAEVQRIMEAKPVKNLTEDEVIATLRLMQMDVLLSEGQYRQLIVRRKDPRLELCDDSDKFLAMLADCDKRDVLLFTCRCRKLFGGTVYHWRKIARKCPIIETVSALSECSSGYYGRGWVIAPHIARLIDWIIKNCDYSKIQKLKG